MVNPSCFGVRRLSTLEVGATSALAGAAVAATSTALRLLTLLLPAGRTEAAGCRGAPVACAEGSAETMSWLGQQLQQPSLQCAWDSANQQQVAEVLLVTAYITVGIIQTVERTWLTGYREHWLFQPVLQPG
jgi:hypothetical protein